ncbi:zinc finger protein 512-like isoform X2 [Sinocyclocheilus anshuiensis]|uniref:zinc finger protein 512-like isoform X2 n=1 Tax=Sinocyclocheilus anshuiensis TaxID=1608454 RepID=UPI0007B8AE15|nr:PREDICTED: zinc finger protein 512-like isoform X2 [Sinocyclocheilus anshuiensis]
MQLQCLNTGIMDQTHYNMSATCVPSRRKMSKPKLNPQTPDVIKDLGREAEGSGTKPSKNDGTSSQKIKRTYTRKKYHDLQPVIMRDPTEINNPPTEDLDYGSSCSSVITVSGLESHHMLTDHTSGVMGKTDGSSSDTLIETDFKLKKKQKMEKTDQPSLKKYIEEVKQTVPVIVPVAQFSQRNQITDSHSMQEQKSSQHTKKESPVYPPGSQEEKWQLQILAKGRVSCPKCKSVGRKTVDGLKKHLETCKLNPFTCPDCGKQLRTSTGMKYHLMADHNNLSIPDTGNDLIDQEVKEKLRKVLKRMGKLKCSKEGCTGTFTSIMGYVYHMKKCGKEPSELEKLLMNCKHCGKAYRSRAGLEYHLKNEHSPTTQESEIEEVKTQKEPIPERTQSGRAKRLSAQVAVFHLKEIASEELLKEWPKRKVQRDLVPDDRKLKYSRPGLPVFSQETLRKWKNEVKLHKKVQCPNKGCNCFYTSVSGLKAHLGLCTLGEFETGKFKCLICKKEFNSESGVKYHINSIHSQDWFVVRSKSKSSKFDKLRKTHPKEDSMRCPDLPSPNPGLSFPQVPSAWQDRQTSAVPLSSGTATPGRVEIKRKEGPNKQKEKESRQEKDCYEFSGSDSPSSSSSSSSESSSSESEAEDSAAHRHDEWALSRPLTKPVSSQQPGSNS